MKTIHDVKPTRIDSKVFIAPFDEALETLTGEGYQAISLAQNAQLRIQQGKDSYISRNGNWTRGCVLYIPGEKPKMVGDSPILYSAKEATEAHRLWQEFYPTKDRIEQALIDSIDFPGKNIKIPTDGFNSETLTVWAFGGEKEAETYGQFLKEAGINAMPVYAVDKGYVDKQNAPFARQMGFRSLDDGSELDGGRSLRDGSRLRGVKIGAEGTVPNF